MNELPGVAIVGTGWAVPELRLSNDDLAERVDTSDEWIRTRTGIITRHVMREGEHLSDLTEAAARQAMANAGVAAEEIDAIIVGTVSADFPFPNAANHLQHRLGLRRCAAFDVSAACSGFVYALVMADSLVRTGRAKTVLVVGADALSRMLDWGDRSTCVLFGDGAGAAVVRQTEPGYGLLGADLGCDGSGGDLLKAEPIEGKYQPGTIRMVGREVFKFAVRIQWETCQAALEQAGITAEQVDWLVPHQANLRIIESAAKGLGIPLERVYVNVDRYGNTSAASIPIALAEAAAGGVFQRGDYLLLVGFGAGLTWGAAVLRWW